MKRFGKTAFEKDMQVWKSEQARLASQKKPQLVDKFSQCSSRVLDMKHDYYSFWKDYHQNGVKEYRLSIFEPPTKRRVIGISQMVVGSLAICAGVVVAMSKTRFEISATAIYAGCAILSFGASNVFSRHSDIRHLKNAIKKQEDYSVKIDAIKTVKHKNNNNSKSM